MNTDPSIILILFSGLLSFFSPCMLLIVPVYLSYISGVGINEINTGKIRMKVFLNTLFFVLGFSAVFIIMQILAIYFANFISNFISNEIIFKVAGVMVIILGLNMTGVITLSFLFKEKKIKSNIKSKNIVVSFIIGFLFGIGWSPCVGPILYSVIAYISKVDTIEKGIFYITVYCIGMGAPFLATGFFMEFFLKFFKKASKFGRGVEIVAGIILIVMGITLFFNKLSAVSAIFS